MPSQKRNEGYQEHNYEEWQACDSGYMPRMWKQDVQDRESLKIPVSEVRKGWVLVMIPGLFIATTHFKLLCNGTQDPIMLSSSCPSPTQKEQPYAYAIDYKQLY